MNSLHTAKNPETFPTVPSNACSLATSVLNPVLGLSIAPTPLYTSNSVWSCAYIATSYFYCC